MITVQQARVLLQDCNMTHASEKTGINRTTLHAIKNGDHTNPTAKTLDAIRRYFRELDNE